MRSRLVMLAAITLAAISVALVVSQLTRDTSTGPGPRATLAPKLASYLGVYESDALAGYQSITKFGDVAGRQPDLAGYFSGWLEPFKTAFATTARLHGAATLVQIDPTGIPVEEIAAGDYDTYLRAYADAVRSFGHPVVIGFGHEMNANWYSWGYGHLPAKTFVAAWQHVVTLFRQQGADNVTWLWTIQADVHGSGPVASWWPGAKYVSWVGIDGYYYLPSNAFATVFGPTIAQIRAFTSKPVLLSETAVGPEAGQAAKIQDLFQGMVAYRTLGLVWFDIAQHDGTYHQDWRIEDNTAAETSLRLGVRKYIHPASPG